MISEARADRLVFPIADSFVARLHELSKDTPGFEFLRTFQYSSDSRIEALYGARGTDRLEKLQYDVDSPRMLHVPGADNGFVQVQISTWASEIKKEPNRVKKLNEDATLVVPLGYGRLLAVVFDGASSQKSIEGLEKYGMRGSWYISHLASLEFPNSEAFDRLQDNPKATAEDVMIILNRWLREKLEKIEGVDYNDRLAIPGMAATIAVIDYGTRKVSIAHAADTLGIAEFDNGYRVLTDDKNARWDEETQVLIDSIVAEALLEGRVVKPVEAKRDERVRDQLKQSFKTKINTPIGTGILNGQDELVTNGLIHTSSINIPADSGLKLHLATDGIHSIWTAREDLKDNPDLQMRKLLGALNTHTYNPGNPITRVTDRLDQDRGGYLFRRGMDDATRVSIVVTQGEEDSPFSEENEELLRNDRDEITRYLAGVDERVRIALTQYELQASSQS